MPITIPKPILLMPKVPSVVVVGLLAAQFLLFQIGHSPEPKCTLKVEIPYYSTSLKETRNIDAIKLNITSTCNVPQKYTEIDSTIQKIDGSSQMTAYDFGSVRQRSLKNYPEVAEFRNLYAPCHLGISVPYSGLAKGFVYLKNGEKYPVEGSSGEFKAAKCAIGAQ